MYYGARFYDPYLNRWIQPDTIVPDPKNPQSLNRFSYVLGNPLKYADPTGHQEDPWGEWYCWTVEQIEDFQWSKDIQERLFLLWQANVMFVSSSDRRFTIAEVEAVADAVDAMSRAMGGLDTFRNEMGTYTFRRIGKVCFEPNTDVTDLSGVAYVPYEHDESTRTIAMFDTPAPNRKLGRWVSSGRAAVDPGLIVHEFAHALNDKHNEVYEQIFETFTGGETAPNGYNPGGQNYGGGPPTAYGRRNRGEDMCESVRYTLFPDPSFPVDSMRSLAVALILNPGGF